MLVSPGTHYLRGQCIPPALTVCLSLYPLPAAKHSLLKLYSFKIKLEISKTDSLVAII